MDSTESEKLSARSQSGAEVDSQSEKNIDSARSAGSDSMPAASSNADAGRVMRADTGAAGFNALSASTPVCYCVYEEVAQGTFYFQWKASTQEPINNQVMMFVPSKTVPKFKLVNDGGRSELATRVMVGLHVSVAGHHFSQPDKQKFWSSLCLFIKAAKEYKGKLQLFPGWNDIVPYKSDIYFHNGTNTVGVLICSANQVQVTKVGYEPIDLEDVAAIGIAGRANILMANKMSKEQFSQGIRKGGYCLVL
ncbi:phosphatase 2A regulatory subunit B, putative [Babesia ovata]|uniref:Phosphatase 2A regulatory subunit B, putative n=1 Tax=Babesia ovata TaxID=189622 RepID=A0A2H6KGH3_9APIC|nr:phosphatase 2A regulatory subunit B, putative [Babesia ovata]GBE62084.1 phosphatase 2A regulatory subunit B, putative [Babesia ovata]